jgi:drug/metabolite transporter superfamily protein YnfA
MKISLKVLFCLLFAVIISLNLPDRVHAVELLTNGGFETGTLAPWVQSHAGCTDNGAGYSPPVIAASYAPAASGAAILTPFAGTRSAFNPWTCGPLGATGVYYSPVGGYTMTQDVTVPAGNSLTLKFTDRLYTNLAFYASPDWRGARPKQYRVEIRNTSNVVLATPLTVTAVPYTLLDLGWQSRTFNLGAAYGGQTIRLAFVWTTTTGQDAPGKVGLDSVSLNAFVPTAAESSVSGRVLTAAGRGISRARLTITDSQSGVVRNALTNQFGYYNFNGLESGHFYILNVQSKSYVFDPDTQSFQLNENLDGVNFIGTVPDSR